MMDIDFVVRSMKRRALHTMKKHANKPNDLNTAKLIVREIDSFIKPAKKNGYIYSYHIKFSMELQDDNSVKRICKMDAAMTDISPWYYFDVEIEPPTNVNAAYERAMGIV